jgi:hypothetical protein
MAGRPKGSKNKEKQILEFIDPNQLYLNLFPIGRPKGSKKNKRIKAGPAPKGLRLKLYESRPSSMGGFASGVADQYGRILEHFVNDKNEWDLRPTGHCISVYH